MADVITDVNKKIVGSVTNIDFMNVIGWIVLGIIVIGVIFYVLVIWRENRLFKKKITAFDIVGINFVPAIRDKAKTVKIGSGGFELLYLKKLKTWKLAYGGKVGKDTYYFFIMTDGYWYNAMLSANIYLIDKNGGYIPVVTTNPSMRAQYTSLEKQIDSLHLGKTSFMDKYGVWMFSIGFLIIAGVFLWLIAKEYTQAMSNFGSLADQMARLMEQMNNFYGNVQTTDGGLVKV